MARSGYRPPNTALPARRHRRSSEQRRRRRAARERNGTRSIHAARAPLRPAGNGPQTAPPAPLSGWRGAACAPPTAPSPPWSELQSGAPAVTAAVAGDATVGGGQPGAGPRRLPDIAFEILDRKRAVEGKSV